MTQWHFGTFWNIFIILFVWIPFQPLLNPGTLWPSNSVFPEEAQGKPLLSREFTKSSHFRWWYLVICCANTGRLVSVRMCQDVSGWYMKHPRICVKLFNSQPSDIIWPICDICAPFTSLDLGVTACPTTLSDKKRSTPLLSHHPAQAGAQGEMRRVGISGARGIRPETIRKPIEPQFFGADATNMPMLPVMKSYDYNRIQPLQPSFLTNRTALYNFIFLIFPAIFLRAFSTVTGHCTAGSRLQWRFATPAPVSWQVPSCAGCAGCIASKYVIGLIWSDRFGPIPKFGMCHMANVQMWIQAVTWNISWSQCHRRVICTSSATEFVISLQTSFQLERALPPPFQFHYRSGWWHWTDYKIMFKISWWHNWHNIQ